MKDELAKRTDIPRLLDAAGSEAANALPAASTVEKSRRNSFWEWLTRRHTLRAARAQARDSHPRARELVRRAHAAAELGDRVFDAVEPLRTGTGKHLAADLYRQSIFWSLSALKGEEKGLESTESLWEQSKSLEGLKLPWEAEGREEVERLMRSADFRALAELSEPDRQRAADGLRPLAHSALELSEPVDRAVRKLLFQRFVRMSALLLALALFVGLSAVGVHYLTKQPDLAAGKPWRTSSSWGECKPEDSPCGGLRSDFFFHTQEDATPWIEYDLANPVSISEVYVQNRVGSVHDRAIPLVIEVSDDAQSWREVARQTESFRSWTASFEPVAARYVRLRVDRRSFLHLSRVEIYP